MLTWSPPRVEMKLRFWRRHSPPPPPPPQLFGRCPRPCHSLAVRSTSSRPTPFPPRAVRPLLSVTLSRQHTLPHLKHIIAGSMTSLQKKKASIPTLVPSTFYKHYKPRSLNALQMYRTYLGMTQQVHDFLQKEYRFSSQEYNDHAVMHF